jgi:transcriptional regulator with XRE-family HTH domain
MSFDCNLVLIPQSHKLPEDNMEETKVTELASWRKKMGISQVKMAKLADVSLATLRHLEIGSQKPRKTTLTKVIAAINKVESASPEELAPKRRGRKPRAVAAEEAPAAVTVARRRGRPPKAAPAAEPSKPGRQPRKPAVAAEATEIGPIRLSNLDLELINRILNMTGIEKIELLRRLT